MNHLESNDIHAYIKVDGDEGRAKVYGASSKDTVTEGYIEGKTGLSFNVHVDDKRKKEEQDDLRAEVYIDGQYTGRRHLWKDVNRRWELSYVRPTVDCTAPLTFSDLVLTHDEEVAKLTPSAVREHIGTIEIRIFKVRVVGKFEAGYIKETLFSITPKVVTQEEVKDKRSHCTSYPDLHYDPRTPLSKAKMMTQVESRNAPYATLKFIYVSRALLGQHGFIIEDSACPEINPTPDEVIPGLMPPVLIEMESSSATFEGFSNRLTENESDSGESDRSPDGDCDTVIVDDVDAA